MVAKNRRSRSVLPSGKANDAAWHEDDHPRGQPDNAGQFASAGGNNELQKGKNDGKIEPKPKLSQTQETRSFFVGCLANGLGRIKGVSDHVCLRISERGLDKERLLNALTKGQRVRDKKHGGWIYKFDGISVCITDNLVIKTAYDKKDGKLTQNFGSMFSELERWFDNEN